MIVSMGIVAGSVFTFVLLDKKGVIHVDSTTVQIITYGGLGSAALYVLYEFGSLFQLF